MKRSRTDKGGRFAAEPKNTLVFSFKILWLGEKQQQLKYNSILSIADCVSPRVSSAERIIPFATHPPLLF